MTQHNVEPINTFHDEFTSHKTSHLLKLHNQSQAEEDYQEEKRSYRRNREKNWTKTSGFYLPSNGWEEFLRLTK